MRVGQYVRLHNGTITQIFAADHFPMLTLVAGDGTFYSVDVKEVDCTLMVVRDAYGRPIKDEKGQLQFKPG